MSKDIKSKLEKGTVHEANMLCATAIASRPITMTRQTVTTTAQVSKQLIKGRNVNSKRTPLEATKSTQSKTTSRRTSEC